MAIAIKRLHRPASTQSGGSSYVRCPAPAARSRDGARLRLAVPAGQYRKASRGTSVQVEANIFSRIARVIRSYITGFVETFEDPEIMLDRITEEMQADALRMRQALARVKASESQLATKQQAAQGIADQWLQRAELALQKGDEELAREALRRRQGQQAAADGLSQQLGAQRKAAEQLGANVRLLETKMQEASSKRETLKARAVSARASREVQELIGGLRTSATSSTAAFERMEQKVMSMEAEAEATGILATPDSLESQFQALEGSGGVEGELAALKRGLAAGTGGRGQGQGQLPAGPPIREYLGTGEVSRQAAAGAVDLDLERLRRRVYGNGQ